MKTNTIILALVLVLLSAPWSLAQVQDTEPGFLERLVVGFAGGSVADFVRNNAGFVMGLIAGLLILLFVAVYWFVRSVKSELREMRARSSARARKIRGRLDRSSKKDSIIVEPVSEQEEDYLAESHRAVPADKTEGELHEQRFGSRNKRAG